jgi:hypothetical protein
MLLFSTKEELENFFFEKVFHISKKRLRSQNDVESEEDPTPVPPPAPPGLGETWGDPRG